MFTQTWKKYLPVITILLKRSSVSEQTLNMNHTDFERASGGRKTKFSFSQLLLNKGRLNISEKQNPLAKELAVLLQEEEATRRILSDQQFEISMNNYFQLTIKNTTPLPEVPEENITEEESDAELLVEAVAGNEAVSIAD